jgi:hypothetical protein
LHREWYGRTALADLLGADDALADPHVLYGCHDRLLAHKEALFTHLTGRWRDLFNVSFEVLLYDLTSTYFESDPPLDENDKRRHGYSRDHRFDCVQIVIALIVTPEGLPLAYEILPGNTNDSKTLRSFLQKIEQQYGKAQRIWCMDRGVPTEEVLAEMRRSEPPVQYLCGTPKGRLNRLEKSLVTKPWHSARAGVKVKLLPEENELYVFATPHASRPTAAQNQRRSDRLRNSSVVQTLGGVPYAHQSLSVGEASNPRSSASTRQRERHISDARRYLGTVCRPTPESYCSSASSSGTPSNSHISRSTAVAN